MTKESSFCAPNLLRPWMAQHHLNTLVLVQFHLAGVCVALPPRYVDR
jgi:hypothetical protein